MAEEHIKINPVPTKVKYSGNGVVREFPTGFAFFENDNIVVYHNGKIIKTGYSITGVGETGGGKVIFNVAPATGDKIIILRKVVVERVTDFQEGGTFRAKNINDELDRQTAFCQQIQEEIERCVKVEVTDEQTPEELLAEVYGKLDSATDVAEQAIGAANQATTAAKDAKDAVVVAQQQITETQAFIEQARTDINQTVEDSIAYVEQEAVKAATEVVGEVVGQYTDRAETAAKNAEADASRTAESADRASASATSAATSASEAEAIAGEISVYNFKNKITNCITEIPQDIKLELNNGTLTLKAGSKVYVPNGKNTDGSLKFDVVTISNDVSNTRSSNVQEVYFVSNNGKTFNAWRYCFSGTTAPTFTGSYAIWYDTANNIVKYTTNAGSTWGTGFSLPVCLSTSNTAQITSIDQVFNGFGYIGSTVFALPGVKGLIPNGRNADGSLKNIEFTVDKVLTHISKPVNQPNGQLILRSNYIQRTSGREKWKYYEAENFFVFSDNGDKSWLDLGTYATDSNGVMTLFQPKLPFRAVDQNDFNKLDDEAVKTSGNQTINGAKTFNDYIVLNAQGGNEGAEVHWRTGSQSVLQDPYVKQDVVGNLMRFFAKNSAGTVILPLQLDFETGNAYSNTVPKTANSTALATTAWVNTRVNPTGNNNSWKITYSNGFMIMGGFLTPASTTSSDWTVTFPTAFSSIPVVQTTYYSTQGTGHNLTRNVTKTGFYFEAPSTGNNYHHNATGLGWIAFGF